MRILKRIGVFILAIIALILIAGLLMKKDYRVEREVSINKPNQQVFDYIKLLTNQNNYSKWAMIDPNMKKTFSGTDGTPGFTSAWEGNSDVGKGEQEIKAIKEGERMETEIRFEKPFKSEAKGIMTTAALGAAQTKVTWAFEGHMPYPFNVLSPLSSNMVGKDLQTGLNNLKVNLEK